MLPADMRFFLNIVLSKLDSLGIDMLALPMDQEKMGATRALVKMPEFPSGANSVLVYFVSDDCAKGQPRPPI
jgi:uncharacterized protein